MKNFTVILALITASIAAPGWGNGAGFPGASDPEGYSGWGNGVGLPGYANADEYPGYPEYYNRWEYILGD
jgi:hypothetical protein